MGYNFQVQPWYKLKYPEREYPWPCKSEPERTIQIFNDDVLTRTRKGVYMKHTGICCTSILIPDEDVELVETPANLRLM